MARIGCGFHIKEVPFIIKSLLEHKNIQSKFEDNLPSTWFVRKFLNNDPDLTFRTPEILGHSLNKTFWIASMVNTDRIILIYISIINNIQYHIKHRKILDYIPNKFSFKFNCDI